MTREEASFILANIDRRVCDDELNEALDMSIKALEQEPILDKIRAEIKDIAYDCQEIDGEHESRMVVDLNDVLNTIDKYTAESEG